MQSTQKKPTCLVPAAEAGSESKALVDHGSQDSEMGILCSAADRDLLGCTALYMAVHIALHFSALNGIALGMLHAVDKRDAGLGTKQFPLAAAVVKRPPCLIPGPRRAETSIHI
jgi:hypothetical protein